MSKIKLADNTAKEIKLLKPSQKIKLSSINMGPPKKLENNFLSGSPVKIIQQHVQHLPEVVTTENVQVMKKVRMRPQAMTSAAPSSITNSSKLASL